MTLSVSSNGASASTTVTFRAIATASEALVSPAAGSARGSVTTVDVAFVPAEGASVATPDDDLVTLFEGATEVHSTAATLVSGTTATYRFSFDPTALESLVAGVVEVHVGPTTVGSFILATPHGVVVSPAGLTVGAAELPGLAIDVQYVPVPGATITAPATLTLTQGLLTATGGAALFSSVLRAG